MVESLEIGEVFFDRSPGGQQVEFIIGRRRWESMIGYIEQQRAEVMILAPRTTAPDRMEYLVELQESLVRGLVASNMEKILSSTLTTRQYREARRVNRSGGVLVLRQRKKY